MNNPPNTRQRASEWHHRSSRTKEIEAALLADPKRPLSSIGEQFGVSKQWVHYVKRRIAR
jgi:hypothetical protein